MLGLVHKFDGVRDADAAQYMYENAKNQTLSMNQSIKDDLHFERAAKEQRLFPRDTISLAGSTIVKSRSIAKLRQQDGVPNAPFEAGQVLRESPVKGGQKYLTDM